MLLELPSTIPAMILPDVTLFPGMMLPLYIFEPRYRRMLQDVMGGNRLFAVVMRHRDEPGEQPHSVCGVGLVRASIDNPDGTSHLFLLGLARARVRNFVPERPYPVLSIVPAPDEGDSESVRVAALVLKLKELVRRHPVPDASPALQELADHVATIESPPRLADLVAHTLVKDAAVRQDLLATFDTCKRLAKLVAFLMEKA